MTALCPTCGQPLLVRHGVKLPPKKAAILDIIENVTKGRGGIELATLAYVFYPGVSKPIAHQRIATHVSQLNDLLAAPEFRIAMRRGFYQFARAPA